MKKILSLCLAALMIFSVLPAAFAADVETIANIEETSEYAEAIKFLNTLKVYNGKANGDLAADEGVERWQAARFIYRVATGDVAETDVKTTTNYTTFKDIDIGDFDGSSAETLGAIAWAAQAKITNGTAADAFSPADGIIYQDAITMIVRLLGERYTAASYPYGFVTTARELGITDGITGVGLEDEITRGVFAQLLYNAIFAEIDGVSLADKNFGVGKTTVIITASNQIVYEAGASEVLKDNKVQFAEIDAQGEPVSAKYHADFAKFGLADDKAANEAVGTLYNIYYTDSMANIISAESLAEVYWNLGYDNISIKASSKVTTQNVNYYITINGSTYQVVDAYTDLNRKQGETSDAAGSEEMKVYTQTGITVFDGKVSNGYIVASNGDIYKIGDASSTPADWYMPYARYSDVLGKYYGTDEAGNWKIFTDAEIDAILLGASSTVPGFAKDLDLSSVTAYAKAVVSANERVNLREYRFGRIDYDTASRTEGDLKKYTRDTFKIATYKGTESVKAPMTTLNATDPLVYETNNSAPGASGEYFVDEFAWSGLQKAQVKEWSYIIYYFDTENQEIDIIDVIDYANDGDDSYIIDGYVRGYDANANTLTLDVNPMDAETIELSVGYDNLLGSMVYTKSKTPYNVYNNISLLKDVINSYASLIVVDGKIVGVVNNAGDSDFIIIDSFVDFTEEGVVVNAYTTVDDTYTEITIGSYNGWSVAGFDYYLYFLSGWMNSLTGVAGNPMNSVLPVKLNTLYKVVYVDNGVYNLTDPTVIDDPKTAVVEGKGWGELGVNKYGYIENTDGSALKVGEYKATANSDYWMILDARDSENVKVLSYNGKLNPVVKITGADVYKVSSNDYVLVLADATDTITGFSNIAGTSVEYVMYNEYISGSLNQDWLSQYAQYGWTINMQNLLTGATVPVTVDPALVYKMKNQWNGLSLAEIGFDNGKIYQVIDGYLREVVAHDMDEVAEFYANRSADFVDGAVKESVKASDFISTNAYNKDGSVGHKVAELAVYHAYPDWYLQTADKTELVNDYDDAADISLWVNHKDYGFLTKSEADIKDVVKAGGDFDLYVIARPNGTSVAWLVKAAPAD